MEHAFLRNFATLDFKRKPVVVFDDIRVWNMLGVWPTIERPKLDLTSFGHYSGTGLVEPGGEAIFELRVGNRGNVVDLFTFEVLGDALTWVEVDPPELDCQAHRRRRVQKPVPVGRFACDLLDLLHRCNR